MKGLELINVREIHYIINEIDCNCLGLNGDSTDCNTGKGNDDNNNNNNDKNLFCKKTKDHVDLMCYRIYIKSMKIEFNASIQKYSYRAQDGRTVTCKGLHSYIKAKYLPNNYIRPTRLNTHSSLHKGNPANRQLGIIVSAQLEAIFSPGGTNNTTSNTMDLKSKFYTTAILKWLKRRGYTPQAVELPVVMKALSRMTRVDFITLNRHKDKLVAWEIKCGSPCLLKQSNIFFNAPLDKIECSVQNQWFLQSLYTNAALCKYGLKTECIKILHCSESIQNDTKAATYKVVCYDLPLWAINHQQVVAKTL